VKLQRRGMGFSPEIFCIMDAIINDKKTTRKGIWSYPSKKWHTNTKQTNIQITFQIIFINFE
jgi:hypothetical protein